MEEMDDGNGDSDHGVDKSSLCFQNVAVCLCCQNPSQ
jgi:hypothetical protein